MRRHAGLLLAGVLLIGCATTAPSSPPAPSPVAVSPSPSAAPTAAAVAEVRGGPLPEGRYTKSGFDPRITFELDEGWQGVQLFSGFFDVQQDPDTPDVIAVQFANVNGVHGRGGTIVPATSAAGAASTIHENAALAVIGESPSLMSGLDGFTVEVENAGAGDVPVVRVPPGPLAISPGRRLWISFFDTPTGVLAIMVGGSVAHWDESLAVAEPVLESVRIGDAAP